MRRSGSGSFIETELAARLDHPGIVPIYAAGEAGERLFIAMRLGPVRLDRNRQVVAPNYLSRVEQNGNGQLVLRTLRFVPNVDQTFGGYFHVNDPPSSRTFPACKRGSPPPWARSG